jgi:hypothetical protein
MEQRQQILVMILIGLLILAACILIPASLDGAEVVGKLVWSG